MANLAIKGHETRGKEVIEILEMLGGKNNAACTGSNISKMYVLTDSSTGYSIDYVYLNDNGKFKIFTLEEFLEKFPYKVGDKVIYHETNAFVTQMEWDGIEIVYTVDCKKVSWETTAFYLQPYNEETKMSIPESMKQITEAAENLIAPDDVQGSIMSEEQLKKQERRIIFQNDAPDKTELVLGDDYEIKVEDGKTFVVRKKPQYPKTLNECCEIVNSFVFGELKYKLTDGHEYDYDSEMLWSLDRFRKLLICRDAYWKIAGEQMGLGKPWKPDWIIYEHKFCLGTDKDKVIEECVTTGNRILAFPTKEMRDAFYENFKELIESCKKLL